MIYLNIYSFLLCLLLCFCSSSRPLVNTSLGKIVGHYKLSYGGRKFSAFEGIPYALPPVGDNRFQEPKPMKPWIGVWEATFLYKCVQVECNKTTNATERLIISGDEDCLYINVYVPRENLNPNEKLDVIVHIHGGGFMFGSSHAYAHPGYLMDREIIFVTFNYRLGIFGFLSTEDNVVPGNNGLKDQVMALKWIQENIATFGGNRDSITLTGASAGAASVHLHYLSPMSRGLFHKGFSQSGTSLNPWTIQHHPLDRAKNVAFLLGCPDFSTTALITCIKQRSYHQILSTTTFLYGYKFEPLVLFGPVIEKGSNSFLDKNPHYLMTTGQINDLPWLVSNVPHEGQFLTNDFKSNINEINVYWENIAPFALYYNYTVAKSQQKSVAQKIKKFYLGDGRNVTEENFHNFIKIFTDRLFLTHSEMTLKIQSNVSRSSIFYYYFNYPGDHETRILSIITLFHYYHRLPYFFSGVFEENPTQNELMMKDVMLDLLVSFAKTGKPSINGISWTPTTSEELTYLNISSFQSENMKLCTVNEISPTNFWKSLGFMENENYIYK